MDLFALYGSHAFWFWLGLAALFSFNLLMSHQYLVQNLGLAFSQADQIEQMIHTQPGTLTADLVIMVEERYVVALVAGLFLLLVVGALIASLAWGAYLLIKWVERLPIWDSPNILVSSGLGLVVVFILGLWFFDSQELLTDAEAVGILHFTTYVLGLVGAGGIGLELSHSLNTLAWPQVSLIFIMILGTVVISEWVSARVRHAII